MSDERTNVFEEVGEVSTVPPDESMEDWEIEMELETEAEVEVEEKEEKSEPSKPAKTSKSSKTSNTSKSATKTFISIDTDPSDVLSYQEEGRDLYFEDGKRFLPLDDAVYEGLSSIHQLRYKTAEQITEGVLDFSRQRVVPRPAHGYATARNRLEVSGVRPGFSPSWQYADQLEYWESMGARPVTDPNVKTFTNPTGTTRTITESDGRKLVLLEMPNEVREGMKDEARRKAKRIRDGFDDNAESSLERSGASVVRKREVEGRSATPKEELNYGGNK